MIGAVLLVDGVVAGALVIAGAALGIVVVEAGLEIVEVVVEALVIVEVLEIVVVVGEGSVIVVVVAVVSVIGGNHLEGMMMVERAVASVEVGEDSEIRLEIVNLLVTVMKEAEVDLEAGEVEVDLIGASEMEKNKIKK